MRKGTLLLAALFLCLMVLGSSGQALARDYVLENQTKEKASFALLVPTSAGWIVKGWYSVGPLSRKTVRLSMASGNEFGFYATAGKKHWGKGGPKAFVSSSSMNHYANSMPKGNKVRQVTFSMKQGNTVKIR